MADVTIRLELLLKDWSELLQDRFSEFSYPNCLIQHKFGKTGSVEPEKPGNFFIHPTKKCGEDGRTKSVSKKRKKNNDTTLDSRKEIGNGYNVAEEKSFSKKLKSSSDSDRECLRMDEAENSVHSGIKIPSVVVTEENGIRTSALPDDGCDVKVGSHRKQRISSFYNSKSSSQVKFDANNGPQCCIEKDSCMTQIEIDEIDHVQQRATVGSGLMQIQIDGDKSGGKDKKAVHPVESEDSNPGIAESTRPVCNLNYDCSLNEQETYSSSPIRLSRMCSTLVTTCDSTDRLFEPNICKDAQLVPSVRSTMRLPETGVGSIPYVEPVSSTNDISSDGGTQTKFVHNDDDAPSNQLPKDEKVVLKTCADVDLCSSDEIVLFLNNIGSSVHSSLSERNVSNRVLKPPYPNRETIPDTQEYNEVSCSEKETGSTEKNCFQKTRRDNVLVS